MTAARWQPVRTAVRCTCGCGRLLRAPAVALFWPYRAGFVRQVLSQACADRLYGFKPPVSGGERDGRALAAGND